MTTEGERPSHRRGVRRELTNPDGRTYMVQAAPSGYIQWSRGGYQDPVSFAVHRRHLVAQSPGFPGWLDAGRLAGGLDRSEADDRGEAPLPHPGAGDRGLGGPRRDDRQVRSAGDIEPRLHQIRARSLPGDLPGEGATAPHDSGRDVGRRRPHRFGSR